MNESLPNSELNRLETLEAYQILDSLPEEAFDDLTALVARACRMPVAYIGFLDQDREWFKARLGLPIAATPRVQAFGDAALQQRRLTVVPDAQTDARFATNPLVHSLPHIRFYAGAPLVTSTGQILGTVGVGDFRPRRFLAKQRDSLTAVARQVMTQLEMRRSLLELVDTIATMSRATPKNSQINGLLCICAACKRVREGKRWTSITDYVEARSLAAFVQGACPDCLAVCEEVQHRPRRRAA